MKKVSENEFLETTIVAVKEGNRVLKFIKNNLLLLSILVSIVVGFGIGIALKEGLSDSDKDVALWFTLPGKLFIRALECLIVPVVFVGVTAATSSLSPKNNLRITLICIGLVLLTHVAATLVGLIGSLVLKATSSETQTAENSGSISRQKDAYDIIADILRSLVPKNIIKAATNQEITRYSVVKDQNGTISYVRNVEFIEGTNILGILTFSILLGLASSVLEEKAALFREFFKSCNDVVILSLRWLILFAPIGIASLIIDAVFEVKDLTETFKQIGLFTGLTVTALLIYGGPVLALIVFAFTRQNPLKYYLYFLEPMLLAFASTSGAVCIHKSLEICENKIKMDSRLSKFTIPFYTALQADAIYSGVSLSVGDYAVIIIMTCILCLCLPSVPSSSIVTILVVLNAINVPGNIVVLYTVEWLLDRVRTAVNLYSHCFCAVITYELSKKNIDSVNFAETPDISSQEQNISLNNLENRKKFDQNNNNV